MLAQPMYLLEMEQRGLNKRNLLRVMLQKMIILVVGFLFMEITL